MNSVECGVETHGQVLLARFQTNRTSLRIGLEVTHVILAKDMAAFCPCPEVESDSA